MQRVETLAFVTILGLGWFAVGWFLPIYGYVHMGYILGSMVSLVAIVAWDGWYQHHSIDLQGPTCHHTVFVNGVERYFCDRQFGHTGRHHSWILQHE